MRKLSQIERPRGGDRGNQYTGGKVSKTNIGKQTGAERVALHEARTRHADLTDTEFKDVKETAMRKLSQIERPRGGDRRSDDFKVSNTNVETTDAERKQLSPRPNPPHRAKPSGAHQQAILDIHSAMNTPAMNTCVIVTMLVALLASSIALADDPAEVKTIIVEDSGAGSHGNQARHVPRVITAAKADRLVGGNTYTKRLAQRENAKPRRYVPRIVRLKVAKEAKT